MPTYFSVSFQFQDKTMYPNLVRDVYSAFFKAGYDFKSGFWVHKKATLEKIINWNQNLLENRFKLGPTQHVKYNYMQMLLNSELFSEMRLYWHYYGEDEFDLSLIIPERDLIVDYDIFLSNGYQFIRDKLNFVIDLAENIWNTGLVTAVQSFPEVGGYMNLSNITVPSIEPFCILKNELYVNLKNTISNDLEKRHIANDSVLIINNASVKQD